MKDEHEGMKETAALLVRFLKSDNSSVSGKDSDFVGVRSAVQGLPLSVTPDTVTLRLQ